MSISTKLYGRLLSVSVAYRWLASCSLLLVAAGATTGCKSAPDNPLIGTWTLTADGTGPKVCGVQQKVTFTEKSTQNWDNQGRTGGPTMISYVMELPNVYIPGAGGNVTYTVSGANIIWYSPYGPCTYSRA